MRSLCTLFFVFLIVYVNAQQLEWSRQIGGLETDSCMFIEESGDGNYIVAGVFTDSMSVITLTCQGDLVSNGGRDIFVLKISPIGQVFWVKLFGSTEADIPVFMHIDNAGNILLYADLGDSTNFDTNGGVQLDSVPNLALIKYDNNMNYVWHKNLDEFCSVYPYGAINSDSNLNVYIGGYESSEAYVSKYDLNGNIIWTKVFESTITASVSSIDIDNHNNVFWGMHLTHIAKCSIFGAYTNSKESNRI